MKFFKMHPDQFNKKSDVPNSGILKTKAIKKKQCENDLYICIENHLDIEPKSCSTDY